MSFEIYVQAYSRGEPSGLDAARVRDLFPVVDAESEETYWLVRYDRRNSCHISVTPSEADDSKIESLCVERPCGDKRLFEALYSLLGSGSVVLTFPGESPPLVASPEAKSDLPPEMVEALGEPWVVASGSDIEAAIRNA